MADNSSSLIKAHLVLRTLDPDAVNGITLMAGFTPTNYTPTPVGGEATTQLSAHLNGVSGAIGAFSSSVANKVDQSVLGQPNGVATLDGSGFVPAAQLGNISATAPLSYSSGALSIAAASATSSGYLTQADWTTFNAKESTSNKGIANGYAGLDSNGYVPLSEISPALQAPFYIEYHVNPNYTGTSTGSYNQPYTTVQAAINAALGGGYANAAVVLHGQGTTENLTINNYTNNLLIAYADGTAVDSQSFVLTGNITISGTSTRIRLKDFKVAYPGGTQPDLIDSSAGRNYFSNMGFEGGGGVQFSGSWSHWREFTDCTLSGAVSLGGTPVAGAIVSTWRVRGGASYTINASGATLALYDNFSVGSVTQTLGTVQIDGGRNFVSGSTITSTSNSPDILSIVNVSLEAPDATFVHIHKTGTSPYILSNVLRDETADSLVGTRLNQGSSSADVRYVPTASANWATAPTSVLLALDEVALASNVASASKTGVLSSADWSTFNAKQAAITPGSISTTDAAVNIANGSASTFGPNVTFGFLDATHTTHGFMSASDKTKLDGLSTPTLQIAYVNSTNGVVTLDNTRNGIAFNDAPTPLSSIFSVGSDDNSTMYMNIAASSSVFSNSVGIGVTPTAPLHVRGGEFLLDTAAGNYYHLIQSFGASADASDATIATLSIPTSVDAVYFVETRITARRTGGISGANGDSGIFIRTARFTVVGGVIAEMLEYTPLTDETYSDWTVRHSFTSSAILVIANGDSGMNINWYCNSILDRAI